MSKKLKYERVKYYIEIESNSGCKLISNIYINNFSNLELQCKCGEPFNVNLNNFKYRNQRQCKKCSGRIDWNLDNLKILSNNLGYELFDYNYSKYTHNLFLKDQFGYLYKSILERLSRNILPDKFNKSNPYTIQNIKLWCKLNNKPFELISDTYEGNRNKLKWKCLKIDCGEEFEMCWTDIHSEYGCQFCAGKIVSLSNCLATKNPQLASEWHPILNGDLTPYDVTCGNGILDVWWQCSKNPKHLWKSNINNRNNGNNCPYCAGRLPSEDYNLLVINPELCLEWYYEKNDKKPEEYLPNSHDKAWWKCKDCGHKWPAIIQSRNSGIKTGCPECNKSKGEKECKRVFLSQGLIEINQEDYDNLSDINKMNNTYFIPQKEFKDLIGIGGKSLLYDFYIPKLNLIIEYDGEYHFRVIKYKNESIKKAKERYNKQQIHDRMKNKYVMDNDIQLIRIPYWEFDNIEKILERELNLQ